MSENLLGLEPEPHGGWSRPNLAGAKVGCGISDFQSQTAQKNGDSAILLKLKIKSDHYNWSQGLNSAPGKSYL